MKSMIRCLGRAALVVCAVAAGARAAQAKQLSADQILRKAEAILWPSSFEATVDYVTHRAKGGEKQFAMRVWKKGSDKLRVKFSAPTDDRDMEVLRLGDAMWQYLPNLKRTMRISPKQEFHGGDFSNSDVMRVHLIEDYTAALGTADSKDEYLLELTAKTDQVAYHRVKYWVAKKDFMPRRQEFYTRSGKLVRKLEFSKLKSYGKLVRPSLFVMRNMLVPSRYTDMIWTGLSVTAQPDDQFEQTALGR